MKPYLKFLLLAFILNFIWEELHSVLYTDYRGGAVTHPLLVFMALKDALILLPLAMILRSSKKLSRYPILLAYSALVISLAVELHALATARWGYTGFMPLVPFLGVGLTPAIQLAVIGYFSYKIVFSRRFSRQSP